MRKKPTGKVRAKRTAPAAAPLSPPPFDPNRRHSIKHSAFYLGVSRPYVDKLIKDGVLEAFHDGARKFITGRSLAARMLPPGAQ